MSNPRPRSAPRARAAVALLIAAACVTALIAVASPAQAATRGWQNLLTYRGGMSQVCKVPRLDDRVTVKLRTNNRYGTYNSLVSFMGRVTSAYGRGTERAAPGEITPVVRLTVNRTTRIWVFLGDNGEAVRSQEMRAGTLRRCA